MTKTVVQGSAGLVAHFKRIRTAVTDSFRSDVLEDIVVKNIVNRFDSGVTPNGRKWEELAKTTIARKRRAGYAYPEKPLHATGSLRESIGVIRGTTTDLLAYNTGLGFRVGVTRQETASYGRFHQRGVGVPQRVFMGLSIRDVDTVVRHIGARLSNALRV